MYRVEIFYNKQGELTWLQYEDERIMGKCQGRDVKRCLDNIKDEKITNIYPSAKETATIVYEDAIINLHNINKIDTDPLMQDYLEVVSKTMEKEKDQRAPTVTRKNKYRGPIIALTTTLLLAMATLGGAKALDKESIGITPADISAYEELISIKPITTDTISFETSLYESETTTINPPLSTEDIDTPEENEEYAFIEYKDRSNSQKLHKAADLYWDTIEKYATMYGLDPELVLALATQERGVHSSQMDPGGATGLMQIQNSVWVNNNIKAYNFETQSYKTIKVTKEKLADCSTNIEMGCMILQNMIYAKDCNILAGLLSYNMGGGSVNKIINKYSEVSGFSRQEILQNQNNCDWHNYRDIIKIGDKDYIPHVLSYLGPDIETYVIKPSGEKVEVSIKNYDYSKSICR